MKVLLPLLVVIVLLCLAACFGEPFRTVLCIVLSGLVLYQLTARGK